MSGLTIGGLRKVGTMHNKLPKTFEKNISCGLGPGPLSPIRCDPSG